MEGKIVQVMGPIIDVEKDISDNNHTIENFSSVIQKKHDEFENQFLDDLIHTDRSFKHIISLFGGAGIGKSVNVLEISKQQKVRDLEKSYWRLHDSNPYKNTMDQKGKENQILKKNKRIFSRR